MTVPTLSFVTPAAQRPPGAGDARAGAAGDAPQSTDGDARAADEPTFTAVFAALVADAFPSAEPVVPAAPPGPDTVSEEETLVAAAMFVAPPAVLTPGLPVAANGEANPTPAPAVSSSSPALNAAVMDESMLTPSGPTDPALTAQSAAEPTFTPDEPASTAGKPTPDAETSARPGAPDPAATSDRAETPVTVPTTTATRSAAAMTASTRDVPAPADATTAVAGDIPTPQREGATASALPHVSEFDAGATGQTGAETVIAPPTADAPKTEAAPGATPVTTPVPSAAPAGAPVAAPAQTQGPTPGPPAAQIAQVVAPLKLSADGIHRLSINLHPADLGAVNVIAELRNGDIHIHLAGATDAGREALRAALPDLRRELQAAGYSEATFDLSQQAPREDQHRQPGAPARRSPHEAQQGAPPAPPPRTEPARSATGLDLHV